jgi:hypothetical protein
MKTLKKFFKWLLPAIEPPELDVLLFDLEIKKSQLRARASLEALYIEEIDEEGAELKEVYNAEVLRLSTERLARLATESKAILVSNNLARILGE